MWCSRRILTVYKILHDCKFMYNLKGTYSIETYTLGQAVSKLPSNTSGTIDFISRILKKLLQTSLKYWK